MQIGLKRNDDDDDDDDDDGHEYKIMRHTTYLESFDLFNFFLFYKWVASLKH